MTKLVGDIPIIRFDLIHLLSSPYTEIVDIEYKNNMFRPVFGDGEGEPFEIVIRYFIEPKDDEEEDTE